jgi:hypothetical protein
MKTVQLDSAAVVARRISRILRQHGFQKVRYYGRTEGFYVHRVGYSSTVHVDYHVPTNTFNWKQNHESKVAQMREVLFELGYKFSHPKAIYIECLDS